MGMVVSGKSGKSAKGGKSFPVAKRHKHVKAGSGDILKGLTKPTLKKLARRGGVKRISANSHDEMHFMVKEFLTTVISNTCTYSDHGKRKTITLQDVKYGLKNQGIHMVGFIP